jgi:hypothetical protein
MIIVKAAMYYESVTIINGSTAAADVCNIASD